MSKIINKYWGKTCAETGKPIRKGSECILFNGKIYAMDSKIAFEWRCRDKDRILMR